MTTHSKPNKYRAAIWHSADRQAEVVLTGPEHAELSEPALLDEGERYALEVGLAIGDGSIEIDDWTE